MQRTQTNKLVLLSLFWAIVLLQEFVPLLGNIPIGPFSLTLIDITIYVAALTMGVSGGVMVGGFWGIITFVRAFTFPSSPIAPLVFTNPLISIVPKLVMGWLGAFLFSYISKKCSELTRMVVAIVLSEIVTAILTLAPIYFFYRTPEMATALGAGANESFSAVIGMVILTNAIPETILAAIVAPVIVKQVRKSRGGR